MSLSHSYLMPLGLHNSPQRCFCIAFSAGDITGWQAGVSHMSALACCVTPSQHVQNRAALQFSPSKLRRQLSPLCCGESPQIFWSDTVEFYLSVFPKIDFNAFQGLESPDWRNSFGVSHLGGPLHQLSPGEVIQVEEVRRDAEPLSDY